MAKQFIFLRHSEKEHANRIGVVEGFDSPLRPRRSSPLETLDRLSISSIDRIVCSSYRRNRQTAKLLLEEYISRYPDRLIPSFHIEPEIGEYLGHCLSKMEGNTRRDFLDSHFSAKTLRCGVRLDTSLQKYKRGIYQCLDRYQTWSGITVFITHGLFISYSHEIVREEIVAETTDKQFVWEPKKLIKTKQEPVQIYSSRHDYSLFPYLDDLISS